MCFAWTSTSSVCGQSARLLQLPEPDSAQLAQMVVDVIDRNRDQVPDAPGALYLRPLLFGTLPTSAPHRSRLEACLIVLASPVWDYFSGGMKPLRIYVEDQATAPRRTSAWSRPAATMRRRWDRRSAARKAYNVDQVLFCPDGSVQETGAGNFLLIRDKHIVTRSLDSTFLHGVTRDSLLTMARDMGFKVEERVFDVAEMFDWVKTGEAALSGTAAVLAGIGTLVHRNGEHKVGNGEIGPDHAETARSARRDPERSGRRSLRLDAQGLAGALAGPSTPRFRRKTPDECRGSARLLARLLSGGRGRSR
jgi:branched-chain amino acid aminotransferase